MRGILAAAREVGHNERTVGGLWRLHASILTLAGVLGVHEGRYLFATPAHEQAGVHA
jgi:hypothetical protein